MKSPKSLNYRRTEYRYAKLLLQFEIILFFGNPSEMVQINEQNLKTGKANIGKIHKIHRLSDITKILKGKIYSGYTN